VIRVFVTGVRLQLLQLMRSGFDISAMLVWPIVFASIAFYLLDATESPRLLFAAALGTAVMMMWAQVVVGGRRARQPARVRHARAARRRSRAARLDDRADHDRLRRVRRLRPRRHDRLGGGCCSASRSRSTTRSRSQSPCRRA
jgi:hypothetical protein